MKSLALLITLVGAQVKVGETPKLPTDLPRIEVAGLSDRRVPLAPLRDGTALVLFFFNEQCGVTFYYKDRIAKLQRDFAPYSVQFLGVRTGQRQDPTGPLRVPEARYLQMPLVEDTDEQLMREFSIGQSVTFVVLDREGRVRYRGGFDDQLKPEKVRHPYLRDALRALVQHREIARTTAPAIGCAILPTRP